MWFEWCLGAGEVEMVRFFGTAREVEMEDAWGGS